ncbi:S66 family peptidase [Deinococcus yavapaiensis]|uniref:Muramoyltetrapeptide carboxypeptidase LdcA involved in peptidoglycan recycling n=1 Tax=Deinococcus yavapaiensis KR-236 TaxID=694435 RepID=A0A318S5U5_9DEIO|nr:S66 peptidase family protein [Deinococcus yavapaiensis]PYE51173.1 muramoyltetrapeptide carboxypeptidase LdcA involved in peptidoglycan recycling [Deinococcus yavapaiensis KR-236]
MPEFIKPSRLQRGDTVASVSLSSGFVTEVPHRYEAGKRQLRDAFGLQVVEAPNALRGAEYLHRHPQARADDLHWALENPEVRGIFSVIGGDDSVRLLPHLDLDLIRRFPKVMLGFSDTTITLMQFLRAGVHAFYGPAILTDLAENAGIRDFVARGVRRALFDARPFGLEAASEWTEEHVDWRDEARQEQPRSFQPSDGWVWLGGRKRVEGHLVGGCLEVLDMLNGTPGWPEARLWDGAILCLETSEDVPPPSQVGYWLRNFGAQGILGKASGLLMSRPKAYTPDMTSRLYDWVKRVAWEFGREDLPIVANMDFGHTSPQLTLPLGAKVVIDPTKATVDVLEAGVS